MACLPIKMVAKYGLSAVALIRVSYLTNVMPKFKKQMPLLLAVDKVYAKIRNLKYRYIREGTLFPEEIDQYEPYAIREALNNCIAHQDYTLAGRINVIEREESLAFTNLGSFVPGDVQRVVMEDAPEEHYRNRFLATAMFNLKMVDTAGGGIRKLFLFQKQRFFPMPDYDFSDNRVKVKRESQAESDREAHPAPVRLPARHAVARHGNGVEAGGDDC